GGGFVLGVYQWTVTSVLVGTPALPLASTLFRRTLPRRKGTGEVRGVGNTTNSPTSHLRRPEDSGVLPPPLLRRCFLRRLPLPLLLIVLLPPCCSARLSFFGGLFAPPFAARAAQAVAAALVVGALFLVP
ncbi:unnamed protein product, partial [Ectocarpus fasciculatus]